MNDPRPPSPSLTPAGNDQPASRPAYEPPRLVKKRALGRVTLFSGGGGGPASTPPLVSNG